MPQMDIKILVITKVSLLRRKNQQVYIIILLQVECGVIWYYINHPRVISKEILGNPFFFNLNKSCVQLYIIVNIYFIEPIMYLQSLNHFR